MFVESRPELAGRLFPLTMAGDGERLRVAAHTAGRGLTRRLADLGLPVGVEIQVVHRHRGGSLVISRGLARMALGAGMAGKILVERADAGA